MDLKKGDKVLFKVCDSALDVRVGVVSCFPNDFFVDLMCEGEMDDFRATMKMVEKVYYNVFDVNLSINKESC